MNIPFLDLQRQYTQIKDEVNEAVKRVLDRQYFILGGELELFESEFADYLGAKYVVGVGSGTDGLILSLMALGIGQGDEIITPANSFIATTNAIIQVGAKPILVDIDPETYQVDVSEVEKNISKKTKAILPVHLYGAPCEISRLKEIAERNNLYLIEDACQAHGASHNNKKVGTFGDLGVFSFYPGKNLGAYGDGGAICTNSEDLYKRLLGLRNYGQTEKYHHEKFGINSRLDELQAAVLRVKLKYLDKWNRERNKIAEVYRKGLKNVKMQEINEGDYSSYHLFVIESDNREKLMLKLKGKGIGTLIHYPVPIHLQEACSGLGYKEGDFPHAEIAANKILSLPIYAELSIDEVDYIIKFLES